MKNRYDYIKAKYGAWVKLKNKTGNVYDPITNTFNLSEEEWQLEIKSNKHVETLRRAPLLFPTLCTQLFDGATSTGIQSWGPTSTLPRPFRESTVPSVNESDDVDSTQREPISDESSAQSKKRKGKETANTANSMLTEVGEDISKVAKLLLDKYASSNMAACMEKLEKLGWGKTDHRYSTAILLFGESADMREVWLLIDPTICETWVRNAGAKYKLL